MKVLNCFNLKCKLRCLARNLKATDISATSVGNSIGKGPIGSSKEEGFSLSFSLPLANVMSSSLPLANVMYSSSTSNWDISTVYTGGTLDASIGVGSNSSVGVGSIGSICSSKE